ncbi:MAG: hypothetical protein RI988_2483 [Pseudomonadota bacterium]
MRAVHLSLLLAVAVLAGCAARRPPAPVEERPVGTRPAQGSTAPAPASATPVRPAPVAPAGTAGTAAPTAPAAPGLNEAPPPGFYTVRPGDTLGRIALDHGQSWRDLARWNGLENPNLIEVGQQLRVVPPGADPTAAVTRPVTPAGRVESRPAEGRAPAGVQAGTVSATAAQAGSAGSAGAPGAVPGATASWAVGAAPAPSAAAPSREAREADEEVAWAWPAAGTVLAGFDEARQVKGLAISGKAGDPVLAAADGRVVYAGSGLRGYGNLVIVKHNATFLSAYAHNQTLLVKEDQVVRRGQKIAEMGSSEAERVQLHFEIRRLGRPVDPARLLPAR